MTIEKRLFECQHYLKHIDVDKYLSILVVLFFLSFFLSFQIQYSLFFVFFLNFLFLNALNIIIPHFISFYAAFSLKLVFITILFLFIYFLGRAFKGTSSFITSPPKIKIKKKISGYQGYKKKQFTCFFFVGYPIIMV